MSELDYYRLLGVRPSATRDEVRRAYRRLARRVHPDANPNGDDAAEANRRMAVLNEAYAVLRDPARRAAYDSARRRVDAAARRARAYEREDLVRRARARQYARARGHYSTGYPHTRAQGAPGRLVFRPPVDQQALLGLLALLSYSFGVAGATMAVQRGVAWWAALAGIGALSGTLFVMAALPSFQGYVVLTPDALHIHPAFGMAREGVYRYNQICDVHWKVRRTRWGASPRILIDYFERDKAGRLNTSYYHSKWLMAVDDSHALFYALRERAAGQKLASTRPTWRAVLVGARELVALMVAVFVFLSFAILCGGSGP